MEVTKAIREFKYNGVALADPGPQYSLAQVREVYAAIYPEIVNADIEGPTAVGNKTVYEFRRAVGTKGSATQEELRAELIAAMAGVEAPRCAAPGSFRFDIEAHQPAMRTVAGAASSALRSSFGLPAAPTESLPPLP